MYESVKQDLLKYVFLNLLLRDKNPDQSGPYQIDFRVEFWSQKSFVLCHNMVINNYCRIIKMSLIIDESSSFFMAFWRQLGRRGVFRLLTFLLKHQKKKVNRWLVQGYWFGHESFLGDPMVTYFSFFSVNAPLLRRWVRNKTEKAFKGQLISKGHFVSSFRPKEHWIFLRISALASKKSSNQKKLIFNYVK